MDCESDEEDDYDSSIAIHDLDTCIILSTIAMTQLNVLHQMDTRNFHPIERRRVLAGTIRRESLQNPCQLVFWKVYLSTNDDALIQLCGFHKEAFNRLLDLFTPMYNAYTPHGNSIKPILNPNFGWKRLLDATACLGLVLAWLRSTGAIRTLCFLFGLVPNSCSIWLRFGKRILVHILSDVEEAKV